jgi:hypothetical protein
MTQFSSRGLGGGSTASSFEVDAPGPLTISYTQRVEVFAGEYPGEEDSRPVWSGDVTLTAKTEILAREPPEYIRRIERPDLSDAITGAISVTRFGYNGFGEEFDVQLDVNRMPENVAFEVFLRGSGGKEYPLGSVTMLKGYSGGYLLSTDALKEADARDATMDLLFRSSTDAARRTIDLYSIWIGEVTLKGLKVERSK